MVAHAHLDLFWHHNSVSEARQTLRMAVACGRGFTIVVTEQGHAWACGRKGDTQLGLGFQEHQLLPALVGGRKVFAGEPLVMLSAGARHTAGVTRDGALWSCRWGHYGQLGYGDTADKLVLTLVGEERFRGTHGGSDA